MREGQGNQRPNDAEPERGLGGATCVGGGANISRAIPPQAATNPTPGTWTRHLRPTAVVMAWGTGLSVVSYLAIGQYYTRTDFLLVIVFCFLMTPLIIWWDDGLDDAEGSRGSARATPVDSGWFSVEHSSQEEPLRVVVNRDCGRCLSSGRDPHGGRQCVDCGGRGHSGPIGANLTPGTLGAALMRYALACERHDLSSVYSQEGIEAGRDRRAALARVRQIRSSATNGTHEEVVV